MCPPSEVNADHPDFNPECARLSSREVYGDFPHHNDGSHLDVGVADNSIWKRHWRRLAVQLSSWYATPSGAIGHRFTAILAAEWWGVLSWSWKSKRPLIFTHVVFTETLGVHRANEIRAEITRRMDLWERGLYEGLVGDSEAECADRVDRAAIGG